MVENALKFKNNEETRSPKQKTTSRIDRQILRVSKIDLFKSSNEIKNELDLISAQTIRRRLQECNLNGRAARKVPHLSLKNVRCRLQFAENYMKWSGPEGIKKWKNIL